MPKTFFPPGTHVSSDGPRDANIIVVGESPWLNECAAGKPFKGKSGNLLQRWFGMLGIDRFSIRFMNLYSFRPPTRSIDSIPVKELISAMNGIHERIARLEKPHVIVTAGNYPTFALTGKGKIRAEIRKVCGGFVGSATEAEKKAGIVSLRGSIYPYRDLNGRMMKVIPVIHPAGVLQMPGWEKRSIADWKRVKRESTSPDIKAPERNHVVRPLEREIENFIRIVLNAGERLRLAVDIETWGNTLSCVGFALSPTWSITIPTTGKYKDNLKYVKVLCESPAQKVLCNGLFDWYWLAWYGIELVNYIWDVQLMHHALDPYESHSLDFLASVYCKHYVYWKDEAKDAEEIVKYAKDLDALYVYNGLDCCYTLELVWVLEKLLHDEGLFEFYQRHYVMMLRPLHLTSIHGMRVDVVEQKKAAKDLRGELEELHLKLNELAGEELYATEERCAYRKPDANEWEKLLGFAEFAVWEGSGRMEKGEIPQAKEIRKDVRKELIANGLTYMMSGVHTGEMRYKKKVKKKTFSDAKLLKFFYETLGLKKQFKMRKRKDGSRENTVALDEDAIRNLIYKYPKAVEPGRLLLAYREKKKEYDYLKGAWDKDGRVRCGYKMITKEGRLSSSKNPRRTGMNMQNLKRG